MILTFFLRNVLNLIEGFASEQHTACLLQKFQNGQQSLRVLSNNVCERNPTLVKDKISLYAVRLDIQCNRVSMHGSISSSIAHHGIL